MITRSTHSDTRQRDKASLDAIFRRKIKARDDYRCQRCNSGRDPQCAHFFTRRREATRWLMEAAVTLCDTCHRYMGKHPMHWTIWLQDRIGTAPYEELHSLSLRVKTADYAEVRRRLEFV